MKTLLLFLLLPLTSPALTFDYFGTVTSSSMTNVTVTTEASARFEIIPSDIAGRWLISWELVLGEDVYRSAFFSHSEVFTLTPSGYTFHFQQEALGLGIGRFYASGYFNEAGGGMSVVADRREAPRLAGDFGLTMTPVSDFEKVEIFQAAGGVFVHAPAGVVEITMDMKVWRPMETNQIARVFAAEPGCFYRVKLND